MLSALSNYSDVNAMASITESSHINDEEERLQQLSATIKDQNELERDIGRQANQMLIEQADERDARRLEKTVAEKNRLHDKWAKVQARLRQRNIFGSSKRLADESRNLQQQIQDLDRDLEQIQKRISDRHTARDDADALPSKQDGNQRRVGETRREFLIRTGKITPFSRMDDPLEGSSNNLAEVMLDAEAGDDNEASHVQDLNGTDIAQPLSRVNLRRPGFLDSGHNTDSAGSSTEGSRKRRRTNGSQALQAQVERRVSPTSANDAGTSPAEELENDGDDSEDMGVTLEGSEEQIRARTRTATRSKRNDQSQLLNARESLAEVDDGNEKMYQARIKKWSKARMTARQKAQRLAADTHNDESKVAETEPIETEDSDNEPECYKPHPTLTDTELSGELSIPGDIYPSLFDYQKTGVQWLWELYTQQVGGIVGDEMGLGKTIQVIAFLAGLHYSRKLLKPVIVVAPATVMKQWVNEFHRWWPPLRVSILHSSGTGMLDVRRESRFDDDLDVYGFDRSKSSSRANRRSAKKIVDRVVSEGHVLVTTYSGLQNHADILIPTQWGYAVLDEGHKIRNPNTAITIYCKELRTPNRVILSGTPMQNNLAELWSLFDFVYPMRLGTLVNFRNQFEIPIKQGGYANASNLQVETALQCAETLKEAISPYLLQRYKADVAADLPKKSEQVLFCKLTKPQRDAYKSFLASDDMNSILIGKRQALFGIDILRKICNHPDLQDHKHLAHKQGYNYGTGNKSGKMQVVKALVELWKDTGHKTLLFSQHRIMLDILEKFVRAIPGLRYLRMDGTTDIKHRQDLVDKFNNNPDIHIFLLTTKVGGLGVNLTGADRVIIYDPDWNPSTDIQARERAWRLGQKREVMIYRLMTAGTIEEKIYHRQIFKQFLTNKILRDPKQRQTFQLKDLHDLFTLGDESTETETGELFRGTEVKFSSSQAAANALNEPQTSLPDESTQIANIRGVSHQEGYAENLDSTAGENDTRNNSSAKGDTQDSRLLNSIFSRTGVHSAHEHDAIINGSTTAPSKLTADPGIIVKEAQRVAKAAARELQRASETARTVPVGTPTWTGEVGVAGRPEPRSESPWQGRGSSLADRPVRGGGIGSAALLSHLAARQANGAGSTDESKSNAGAEVDSATWQPRGKEFMAMIRDYLLVHGGRCYTQMLINHFNRFCNTPNRTAEFKEMLHEIAVLEKRPATEAGSRSEHVRQQRRRPGGARLDRGGRGIWVLKKEFGGTA